MLKLKAQKASDSTIEIIGGWRWVGHMPPLIPPPRIRQLMLLSLLWCQVWYPKMLLTFLLYPGPKARATPYVWKTQHKNYELSSFDVFYVFLTRVRSQREPQGPTNGFNIDPRPPPPPPHRPIHNTLLKSDVTRRDHVVCCRGSQECWFTLCQFRCQFHSRRHSLRITLNLQHWCACAVVTREPRNRDNGASDVCSTAYSFITKTILQRQHEHVLFFNCMHCCVILAHVTSCAYYCIQAQIMLPLSRKFPFLEASRNFSRNSKF